MEVIALHKSHIKLCGNTATSRHTNTYISSLVAVIEHMIETVPSVLPSQTPSRDPGRFGIVCRSDIGAALSQEGPDLTTLEFHGSLESICKVSFGHKLCA